MTSALRDLEEMAALLRDRRVVVLSGAGMSTESGIPDYRGPGTARRARNPIQFRHFVDSAAGRRRYWARSLVGYRRMRDARPNTGHAALAALERQGKLEGIITQNVDGLHHAAGSKNVVELHGSLARVRCLACEHVVERVDFQRQLEELNAGWVSHVATSAPDGDADLEVESGGFAVPECPLCGGVYKPDVVFFGESVPKAVVADAWAYFERADVLLVAGSSLAVFSGYRFALRAKERGIPIAIINLSPTRASDFAAICVHAKLGDALPELYELML